VISTRAALVLVLVAAGAVIYWRTRRLPVDRQYYRDILAMLGLALIAIVFFWRPLFEPGIWLPAGGGDLSSLIYPNYRFAAESIRGGDFPLWNRHILSGVPFAADIQSGILYPINLIVFLIVPQVTYRIIEYLVVFHVALAGIAAYWFARFGVRSPGMSISRPAAMLGGVAYMLSDFFVVHVGNLNLIASAAWLPFVALLARRAFASGSPRTAAYAGGALAMALLAGHVQPTLYAVVVVAAFFAFEMVVSRRRSDRSARWFRLTGQLSIVLVIGACASALQLLPAYELSQLSNRARLSLEAASEFSLAPSQLIGLIVPTFFGRGPAGYWGQWHRVEIGYAGVLPLVFALMAVVVCRERVARQLLLLGLVGLAMALGGHTVLHGLLWQFVPGFEGLRAPARAVLIFDFALAGLAALGADTLVRPMWRDLTHRVSAFRRGLGLVTAVVVVVITPLLILLLALNRDNPGGNILPRLTGIVEGWILFAIFLTGTLAIIHGRQVGWMRPTVAIALAIGLASFDLISGGHNIEISDKDPVRGFVRPAIHEFLRSDTSVYRIDTDTGILDIWQPNSAMLVRAEDVIGGVHPLELADLRRYWAELGSRTTPLYDALNVRYIILRRDVPLDWSKWNLVFDGDPDLVVYQNANEIPRAYLVDEALVEPDRERLFARLHEPGFDPRRTVLLEQGTSLGPSQSSPGDARVTRQSSGELEVSVSARQPAVLVISEVFYPGWVASLNGQSAPLLRANYLFRAVHVSPGEHIVRLRFEPGSWYIGRAVSAITWLALALLVSWPVLWPMIRAFFAPMARFKRPIVVKDGM
jgi:hypothetical protein